MDEYIKYIRLGDVIETFDLAIPDVFEDCSDYYESGFSRTAIEEELRKVQTADVAPVRHGKWTPVKYNAHCSCGKSYGIYHFLCSVCNHISYSQPYGLNYCPNCGAKMVKEEQNG